MRASTASASRAAACAPWRGRTAPPAPPAAGQAQPVVTAGEGGVVSLHDRGHRHGRRRAPSRSRAPPARPCGCRSGATTRASICRRTASAPTRRARSRSRRSRASIFRRVSAAARPVQSATVSGNGIGAPDRSRALRSARPATGDGTSTVTAQAPRAATATASTLRYGIVREGQRCTTAAGGDDGRLPGSAGRRRVLVHASASSPGSTASAYGTATTTASVRAAAGRPGAAAATRSWSTPTPNVGDGRAEWVIRAEPHVRRAGPQPQLRRVRRAAERDLRSRPGHPGALRPQRSGAPRPRGRPSCRAPAARPTRCRRGGACRRARAAGPRRRRRLVRRPRRGHRPRSPSATRDCVTTTRAGAVLPHTRRHWAFRSAPSASTASRVTVDWSAQAWGLAPARPRRSRATCDPNLAPDPPHPRPAP